MDPLLRVSGPAAALPMANIDTDVIMPKQFLKGIDHAGLDVGALHELRFDPAGRPRPDFVLNQFAWQDVRFLVVGPNFGCGSSREHAVWGLLQLGIRALVGTSFAGIFADNAANNGLLLVSLAADEVLVLSGLASTAATNRFTVDLEAERVEAPGLCFPFRLDPLRRRALMLGLDAIGSTLEHVEDIRTFQAAHHLAQPWLA